MLFVKRLFAIYKNHSWECFAVFSLLYVGILVAGAAIFKRIEEPAEVASYLELKSLRSEFLNKLNTRCSGVTEEDLDLFLRTAIKYGGQKISIFSNETSEPNWSMGQALFFAGTIITTLGNSFLFLLT